MLETLTVRNFALVDSLTLSFDEGFTALTGETGAGKSIIVGALSFLLGGKAGEEVIRTGCDEASVSAIIALKNNRDALDWLEAREITASADDASVNNVSANDADSAANVIVRRSVKSNGRSSVFIQNVPVSRTDLGEFMAFLFDLHGQHSHETLLRRETHRKYLDQFAGLAEEALEFNRIFLELVEKRKELEASLNSEKDRNARIEILEYGIEETGKAAPRPGESAELETEAKKLGDFEKLLAQVNAAASSFYDDETSLLSCARGAKNGLDNASAIDNSLEKLSKRLNDLYFEIEDLAGEFRTYRDHLNYDPDRLEAVEDRLNVLYKLRKKYIPKISGKKSFEEDIILWKTEAETELAALKNLGENRDKLRVDISGLEKNLYARASALTAKRKAGSSLLAKKVTEILSRLGMPNASFAAQVSPKNSSQNNSDSKNASVVLGPWGADEVEFMISANTGEPMKELARIASGGEHSRVMLAIKTILSDNPGKNDSTPDTLIFDEIDTGIGGEVALAVGEYLAQTGKRKQIFCVTHLATIAVRCDNHFRVEKKVIAAGSSERTVTQVTLLKPKDQRQEIARMLAGSDGQAALAHADNLLAEYGHKQGGGV